MYLTIIILPLLGSIVSGFFGRKVGVTGAHINNMLSKYIYNYYISYNSFFWSRI